MHSTTSNAEAEEEDLIDFAPSPDQLARPRPAAASTLPLAVTLAITVAVVALGLLWINRPGPAPARAAPGEPAPLFNAERTPIARVELFELPPYDEAQAARDLAAGRSAAR
jgi:hypothetical protein